MKALKTYLFEELVDNDDLRLLIHNAFKDITIYSKLQPYVNDETKFSKQKQNEKIIIDAINDNNNTDLKALTTGEWYSLLNNGSDFDKLNDKEKAKFDGKNGDIIIIDKYNHPVYFVDVKTSDKYYGAISYKSFINFNDNGFYLLINLNIKKSILVSHKDVKDIVDDDNDLYNKQSKTIWWNKPTNNYTGANYKITRQSTNTKEDVFDESFLKGIELGKIFHNKMI